MKTVSKVMIVLVGVMLCTAAAWAGDIYVDDDYGTNCATATGAIDDPYCTIQEAVDAASAGDTIHVEAGTYVENVTIPAAMDNLQLLGAGSACTTIDISGIGGVAVRTRSPVRVKGFYITGPGRGSGTAIKIENATSSGTADDPGVIENNKVDNVNYGVQHGDWNVVHWEFKNNDFDLLRIGIGLENMSHVVVTGNTFNDYKEGVSAGWDDDTADDVTITYNEFLGSHHNGGDELAAIVLSSSTNQYTISHNRITDSIVGILVKDKDNANTPDLANVTIAYNSIAGNTTGITNEQGNPVSVTLLAENNWWGNATGPDDPSKDGGETAEVPPCTGNPAAEINTDGIGDPVSDDSMQAVDYCPWLDSLPTLTLNADDYCLKAGENTVIVSVDMTNATSSIVGGQFFLQYDKNVLDFVSMEHGDSPFIEELYEVVDEDAGTIDYAVNAPAGDPGTSNDTTMARITFTALAKVCDVASLVSFRTHIPPTRLSGFGGGEVLPVLNDVAAITIDHTNPSATPPTIVTVQCDNVLPDAATNYAEFVAQGGTASDNCTADNDLVISHVDGALNGGVCGGTIDRTYRVTDACGNYIEVVQVITVDDDTNPSFVGFPGDVTQNADAGGCTAVLVPGIVAPTGDDNCDPNPVVTYERSDDPGKTLTEPYPSGTTTITWRVEDACGNFITQDQKVTINAFNDLVVDVELSPTVMAGPFTRCITFELWECTGPTKVTVGEVLTFDSGSESVVLDVPCGDYECITARDKLHTLRRTIDPLPISGSQYVADFVTAGKDLIGGDLNDDGWIDILDFGVFSAQWGASLDPNTTCAISPPHSDIDGSGVVWTEDFTFIQINFLLGDEDGCCGWGGPGVGPTTRISLDELDRRGLGHLKVADLNNDGWLDELDIVAFMEGKRPQKPGFEADKPNKGKRPKRDR